MMSYGIVDNLKLIKVKEHHGDDLVFTLLIGYGLSQPVIKEVSIGKTGQRIMGRLIHQLLFKTFTFGNIMHHKTQDILILIGYLVCAQFRFYKRAVLVA